MSAPERLNEAYAPAALWGLLSFAAFQAVAGVLCLAEETPVLGVIFLTEMTSNTATAAAFLPIIGAVALGMGVDVQLLVIPVALAATCAFMLPVATPPNAIAYGSGYITIAQMVKAGVWLNIIGIVLITIWTLVFGPMILGITI